MALIKGLFPLLSLVHVIFSFLFPATPWLCLSKWHIEYLNINAGNRYHDFLGSFSREGDQEFLSGLFKQNSSTVRASSSITLLDLFSLKVLVMPLLESAALLCAFTASQVRELICLENYLFFSGSWQVDLLGPALQAQIGVSGYMPFLQPRTESDLSHL